jgi:xylan 1,4-beta-xylosidase
VLNFFRMTALMKGVRVGVSSNREVKLDDIMAGGVRGPEDVDAFATADARQAAVMVWNYHDAEKTSDATPAAVTVRGLPKAASRVRLTHYRIDDNHSNAYTVWKAMGSPQYPSAEQIAALKDKEGLQLLEAPRWLTAQGGAVTIDTVMPSHAISLMQLDW